MFYSKSRNGFYSSNINGGKIPDDSVRISLDKYNELMDGQSKGKRITGGEDGFPVLVDRDFSLPDPEYFTHKTDIWQRVTDDEAELLDGQLEEAPAKQRRMWNDSITIEHNSEYFPLLREQMIAEFGESRTDEILAPSN